MNDEYLKILSQYIIIFILQLPSNYFGRHRHILCNQCCSTPRDECNPKDAFIDRNASHIHTDIGKSQLNLYLVITCLVVHLDVRFVTVVPFSMLLFFRSTYIETIDFRVTGNMSSGCFRSFMIVLKRSKQ